MVLLRKSLKKFWPILLLLGGVTGCWFDKTKMSTVHVVTDWGHGINDVYARTSWIMLFVFLGYQFLIATHFGDLERRKAIRTFLNKCTVITC